MWKFQTVRGFGYPPKDAVIKIASGECDVQWQRYTENIAVVKQKLEKMRADGHKYILLGFTMRGRQKQEFKPRKGRMPDVTLAG